mmetsp:Transcript_57900/g.91615  ORF Transcript_57900/g.91615 Transcript_57900/m.91615 type:complete len:258 (+) Transcript_57900:676-1449(+)
MVNRVGLLLGRVLFVESHFQVVLGLRFHLSHSSHGVQFLLVHLPGNAHEMLRTVHLRLRGGLGVTGIILQTFSFDHSIIGLTGLLFRCIGVLLCLSQLLIRLLLFCQVLLLVLGKARLTCLHFLHLLICDGLCCLDGFILLLLCISQALRCLHIFFGFAPGSCQLLALLFGLGVVILCLGHLCFGGLDRLLCLLLFCSNFLGELHGLLRLQRLLLCLLRLLLSTSHNILTGWRRRRCGRATKVRRGWRRGSHRRVIR